MYPSGKRRNLGCRSVGPASGFEAGFRTNFITETGPWVFGESSSVVDGRDTG
jgi:hypothetical protein